MAKMLLAALIFGVVISLFYLIVAYLAFRVGLIVYGRNPYLEWIKRRKTFLGNILQVGIIVAALNSILYILYILTSHFGKYLIVAASFAVVWITVFIMTEEILARARVPKSASVLIGAFNAFLILYLWFSHVSWFISDFAALMLAAFSLILFKKISVMQSLIIGIAVVAYDIIAVFGTGLMVKFVEKAAVTVPNTNIPMARNMPPIALIVPSSPEWSAHSLFIIGLGDVFIPGLIVIAAIKAAIHFKRKLLAISTLAGYVVGVMVAAAVLRFTATTQPATIYLIPGVVLGFLFAALYCGKAKEVFVTKEGPD